MTVEQRVARLEGAYEHLATKADIAELKGQMRVLIVTMTSILAIVNIVVGLLVKFTS